MLCFSTLWINSITKLTTARRSSLGSAYTDMVLLQTLDNMFFLLATKFKKEMLFFSGLIVGFGILKWRFYQLHSFAKKKKKTFQCLSFGALSLVKISDCLYLPTQAAEQLSDLQHMILTMQRECQDNDEWIYIWSPPLFTSSQAYKHLHGSILAFPLFKWMWKSWVQNKHNSFLLVSS